MFNLLRRGRRILLVLGLSFATAFSAHAAYSNVYIFGDSLSDTGNVYSASNGVEPPASLYYQGRLSNGPVWVETLASRLGFASASTAWRQGGNNYAWAGAFSGVDGIAGAGTGLISQVFGQWGLSHTSADPNALYVLGIGGNDLRYVDNNNQPSDTPHSEPGVVLGNLLASLSFLIDHGARNFLVANIPDLGLTPEAVTHSQESSLLVKAYNTLLADQLDGLEASRKVSITEIDLFGIIGDVVADANTGGTRYGITNATTSCWALNPLAPSCDDSVFFDYLHPTARVHALAGELAYAALAGQQIPEPRSSLLLVATALGLALAFRRRPKTDGRVAAFA